MKRSLIQLLLVSWLLTLASPALADQTISGTQSRGKGSDGKLTCAGVAIFNGGTVVRATDSGAGFWLQNDKGKILRFNRESDAVGTVLDGGTWWAYPNLYRNNSEAGVSVTVATGAGEGASTSSTTAAPGALTGSARDLKNTPGSPGSKITGVQSNTTNARSIAGSWLEGKNNVSISQAGDKVSITCKYKHPQAGAIEWICTGTFVDGKLKVRLVHTRAPAGWQSQIRQAGLSSDGRSLSGTARLDDGTIQPFTWTRQ